MLSWMWGAKSTENMTVFMLASAGRVVKKDTLAREFNDTFFRETATNVAKGWNTAWFYENEQAAQKARLYEHGRTAIFKLVLPETACQKLKKSEGNEISIDTSVITAESIQTVTVEESPKPISYIIHNPLLQKNAEITEIKTPMLPLFKQK